MLKGTVKELIPKMLKLDESKIYELKEYIEKRSLNQNSYYHKLKNELAKKTKIPAEEIHREMIFKSCPFEEYLVPDKAELKTLKYYQVRNRIENNGNIFKVLRVYTGSSLLDTKEMGILLDNMIEECQLQGINTLTPEEIAKMRSLEKEG